jgi:hypothetical protein
VPHLRRSVFSYLTQRFRAGLPLFRASRWDILRIEHFKHQQIHYLKNQSKKPDGYQQNGARSAEQW